MQGSLFACYICHLGVACTLKAVNAYAYHKCTQTSTSITRLANICRNAERIQRSLYVAIDFYLHAQSAHTPLQNNSLCTSPQAQSATSYPLAKCLNMSQAGR